MTHDEAFTSRAAERYVAGEMMSKEQDAFEEHFFDCPRCAAEVRMERTFVANLRAVAREDARTKRRRASRELWNIWGRPVMVASFAANFVFLIAVGYTLLAPGRSGQPHFVENFYAPGPARGDLRILPPGTHELVVRFPSLGPQYSYSYQIRDASEKVEAEGPLAPPASSGDELCLEVPIRKLRAGDHRFEVHASPGGQIVSTLNFHNSR
jgi:hypothetical protein